MTTTTTTPPPSFAHEHTIATLAVQKAVLVTRKVLHQSSPRGTQTKPDKTHVSLADFAAQALLVAAIHHNFPSDTIVGEEDTAILRSNPDLASQVWDLVSGTHLENAPESEALLQSPTSLDDMLKMIDLGGTAYGGPHGRVWMIDPIDGTKGYLTGGQYVVCATLLIDGAEKVAAFGCPHVNLTEAGWRVSEHDTDTAGPGYLVSAVKGQGTQVRQLSSGALAEAWRTLPIRDDTRDLSKLRFCENVNTTGPQFPRRDLAAQRLGAPWAPVHIYSTQLRYIALALGAADVVLRMPKVDDKPAHVWDHAGGIMVFEEAGGEVTDLRGRKLNLTTGRDLTENFGLVAAPKTIHARVVGAVKDVLGEFKEYDEIMKV